MRRIFRLSWNPPSLVPQRESGSLLPVIIMKIGVFILRTWSWKTIRISHRSGNPESFSPSNLVRVCRNVPVGTSTCPPGAS